MKIDKIYQYLDELSPFELQESWDNSGLIVGDLQREVKQIVVSLDIDEDMIENTQEDTLFVVHHPLIFGKLKELNFGKYPANLIERLIQKRQSLIAMHTNFDKTHLNNYVFEEILGLEIENKMPFLYEAKVDWTLSELQKRVKEAFGLKSLKVVAPKEYIGSIALCTGSGASLIDSVEADCFLTGDIKYHDAMKAMSQGLMMVDIGHWESEHFFAKLIAKSLKTLPISVIITQSKNPFTII